MRKIYTIIAVMATVVAGLSSCVVEQEQYRWYPDKGETVTRSVVETISDHIDMVRIGFAAIAYEQATEDEKVIYENTIMRGLMFRKLDGRWAVSTRDDNYYVTLDVDAGGDLREMLVLRAAVPREELPLFDSCKVKYKGGDDWQVEIPNFSIYQYNTVRAGEADLDLVVTWDDVMPSKITAGGSGRYKSHREYDWDDIVDIGWELANGVTGNPRQYGLTDLRKATLDITAGPAGETPDRIKAVIDRDNDRNDITILGR